MLALILDGRTAIDGARQGIELCLRTVIPSLFPFFVLSILLTSSLLGSSLAVLRPLGRLFGMPDGAESLLIPAFLGGYPVGAQNVAAAFRSGQLTKPEAERLLSFCSNAGPAFLFGMAAAMFPRRWMAWALWGIHIVGALFAALLIPGKPAAPVRLTKTSPHSPASALNTAIHGHGNGMRLGGAFPGSAGISETVDFLDSPSGSTGRGHGDSGAFQRLL